MAHRPYFKHGIEQLQELVNASLNDEKVLKLIQHELGFRNRPKARALKAEVDELVLRLSDAARVRPPSQTPPPVMPPASPTSTPDRVVVECANCRTPNFVSTLEGVVQHLSCSACKSPYEAQFKYGVMRSKFQAKTAAESSGSSFKWIVIGLAFVIILVAIAK